MIDVITEEGEDGPPPKGSKRMTGKNAQPPHPLEDIVAIETEQVVHTHVGDIIQIFRNPQPHRPIGSSTA